MPRRRRWNGWGFEDESLPLAPRVRGWLRSRLGDGAPVPAADESAVSLPSPRPLSGAPVSLSTGHDVRLRHARGQSFPDILSLRSGHLVACPDAVAFPSDEEEVVEILGWAASAQVTLVPRGGGTSVVGGVTVAPGARPVVVVSLDRLSGLLGLDETSGLARFGAGTYGPDVEAALAPYGLRLGHEPQSFELSTVGGWVATRSAGHRSTGVGKIDELVAGVEVATAAGMWVLPAVPASAAGPELRRLILGSEGRMGILTAVTVRTRPIPGEERGTTVHFPTWNAGVACCRDLLRHRNPVEVLRLSDPTETAFGLTLLELPSVVRVLGRRLARLRRFKSGCMLLLGWTGGPGEAREGERAAADVWRRHGGISVGRAGWRRWRGERFRHPYLRDALLDVGVGIDTLETAAPWASLAGLYDAVRSAIGGAARKSGFPVEVLCHLSHAYRDGSSLYFTFFWPLSADGGLAQWAAMKGAATTALLDAGGTVSHHHGVGTMHAPYLEREIGRSGVAVLRAAASVCDPRGTLNPGIVFAEDPES